MDAAGPGGQLGRLRGPGGRHPYPDRQRSGVPAVPEEGAAADADRRGYPDGPPAADFYAGAVGVRRAALLGGHGGGHGVLQPGRPAAAPTATAPGGRCAVAGTHGSAAVPVEAGGPGGGALSGAGTGERRGGKAGHPAGLAVAGSPAGGPVPGHSGRQGEPGLGHRYGHRRLSQPARLFAHGRGSPPAEPAPGLGRAGPGGGGGGRPLAGPRRAHRPPLPRPAPGGGTVAGGGGYLVYPAPGRGIPAGVLHPVGGGGGRRLRLAGGPVLAHPRRFPGRPGDGGVSGGAGAGEPGPSARL